jgi:prevent-host-death family protein
MKFFSAAEANRQFSKILREVRGGETVVVTSHGEPVAKIVPAGRDVAERENAKQALLDHLRAQPAQNLGITWTRDELYD